MSSKEEKPKDAAKAVAGDEKSKKAAAKADGKKNEAPKPPTPFEGK